MIICYDYPHYELGRKSEEASVPITSFGLVVLIDIFSVLEKLLKYEEFKQYLNQLRDKLDEKIKRMIEFVIEKISETYEEAYKKIKQPSTKSEEDKESFVKFMNARMRVTWISYALVALHRYIKNVLPKGDKASEDKLRRYLEAMRKATELLVTWVEKVQKKAPKNKQEKKPKEKEYAKMNEKYAPELTAPITRTAIVLWALNYVRDFDSTYLSRSPNARINEVYNLLLRILKKHRKTFPSSLIESRRSWMASIWRYQTCKRCSNLSYTSILVRT